MQAIENVGAGQGNARRRNGRNKITLPDYTVGEEILNSVSHGIGAMLGILVLVLCVTRAVGSANTVGAVTSALYGAAMIIVYATSAVYHGLPKGNAKKVFRVLDHCVIYLLISGTYTPITLSAMVGSGKTVSGLAIFFAQWVLAAIAITLTAIDMKKFSVFSMTCYIVMGWMAFFSLRNVVDAMSVRGFAYILGGGILYTVGAVLYGLGKKARYIHGIFHVFTLAGSFVQFLGVYNYCL